MTEEAFAKLVLPMPPSINALYRAVKGRSIVSKKYREWQVEAGHVLVGQRPPHIRGPVSITVELTPPDRRKRDLDNAGFKAVLDLLVTYGVIEADDNTVVREITARWVNTENECTVSVEAL